LRRTGSNKNLIGRHTKYVNYPYFSEIIQKINGGKWNIGWHSSSDLKELKSLSVQWGFNKNKKYYFGLNWKRKRNIFGK
jgi:hypothetical protein